MMENYLELLELAKTYSMEYIEKISEKKPFPSKSEIQNLEIFDQPIAQNTMDEKDVLRQLHKYGAAGTTAQNGGRYFGYVNGGLLPIAHAAEWLVDTWNQNTALYTMSPTASKLEEICEKWLVDLLGLKKGTVAGFVTGSANALLCAFLAARHDIFKKKNYDVRIEGMRNAPKMRVVTGSQTHATVKKALSIIGIGENDIEIVPVDNNGSILVDQIPTLDESTLVIIQAGNVNGGGFDAINEICDMANQVGAWIHVDGAFGLWAQTSKKYNYLTKGIEKADSCSMDAHKTLNAGYDSGIVFCKNRHSLAEALQASGEYLQFGENRDGMQYVTEMSRRGRAIVLWAVLAQLGKDGVEQLINKLCEHTDYFANNLKNIGFKLVCPVSFNQFMIKCDSEEKTNNVLSYVQNSGICWCGGSRWQGESVIRISVCSESTSKKDLDQSLSVFESAFNLT